MAATAERPPSEQGVEFQTLDAIAEIRRQLDELAQRPVFVPQANWWDVLPPLEGRPWSDFAPAGQAMWLQLPVSRPEVQLMLRITWYADRLELTLQLNGGWIVWQRALFFHSASAFR